MCFCDGIEFSLGAHAEDTFSHVAAHIKITRECPVLKCRLIWAFTVHTIMKFYILHNPVAIFFLSFFFQVRFAIVPSVMIMGLVNFSATNQFVFAVSY